MKIDKEVLKRVPNIDDRAYLLAIYIHSAQFRRDGKTPYFNHLEAVANKVEGPTQKAVAYLHDSIEDTNITLEDLADLFPEPIVKAVDAITKRKGENYKQYLARVKANWLATKVKIADISHNYSDSPTSRQKEKYEKAMSFLILK